MANSDFAFVTDGVLPPEGSFIPTGEEAGALARIEPYPLLEEDVIDNRDEDAGDCTGPVVVKRSHPRKDGTTGMPVPAAKPGRGHAGKRPPIAIGTARVPNNGPTRVARLVVLEVTLIQPAPVTEIELAEWLRLARQELTEPSGSWVDVAAEYYRELGGESDAG